MANNLLTVSGCIKVLQLIHGSNSKFSKQTQINSRNCSPFLDVVDRVRLANVITQLSKLNTDQVMKLWLATLMKQFTDLQNMACLLTTLDTVPIRNSGSLPYWHLFFIIGNFTSREKSRYIASRLGWLYHLLQTSNDKPVKLEVLWMLNKHYILQISSYLFLFEKFHEEFVRELVSLTTISSKQEQAYQILNDTLFQLISINSLPSLKQICQHILNDFVRNIVCLLYSKESLHVYNYLESLTCDSDFLRSDKETFFSIHLVELLTFDPKVVPLNAVISEQIQHFETQEIPRIRKEFFFQLSKMLTCREAFQIIFSAINNGNVNIWIILSAISILCECFGEKSCQEILDNRFCESAANHDGHTFFMSLIFIRQIFLQDSVSFQKYAKWFKNLRLNNKQSTFFLECLEKIVPHEPSLCLKIHVNEFPNIPCRTLLSDYITLAKTRLLDLKETSEYQGIFYLSDKNGQRADLRKIISHFVQTGEVAKLLIEASVFRRQYFNSVFLPYLLGDESENLEGKSGFIKRLYKQGLIPANRYQIWQKSQLKS